MAGKKGDTKGVKALQDAAREFDLLGGEEGAGQEGGETFIQSLQPFGTGAHGAPERQEGFQHKAGNADPALLGITRNLKFAETLVNERKELDPGTISFLEGHLGQSIKNVKVYTGKFSDMAARALGAEAFAVEQHIFLRTDVFNPSTSSGLGLLAHELTHTMQKSGSRDEKESEARGMQAMAAEMAERANQGSGGGGGGEEMELALDQAGGGGGDVPTIDGTSLAPAGEGKDEDEDVTPADVSRAPDEEKVFLLLRDAILKKLRDETDLQWNIDGMDVLPPHH